MHSKKLKHTSLNSISVSVTTGPKTPPEPESQPELDNASRSTYSEDGEISTSPDEATYLRNIRTPPEPELEPENEPEPKLEQATLGSPIPKETPDTELIKAEPKNEIPVEILKLEPETVGNLEELPKKEIESVVEPPSSHDKPTESTLNQEQDSSQAEIDRCMTPKSVESESLKTPANNLFIDSIIDSVILKSQTTTENPVPLTSLSQNLNLDVNNGKESLLTSSSNTSSHSSKKSKQNRVNLNQMDSSENNSELKGDENRATLSVLNSMYLVYFVVLPIRSYLWIDRDFLSINNS